MHNIPSAKQHSINFMRHSNATSVASIVLVAVSILIILVKGFNLSIDFAGGISVEFSHSDHTLVTPAKLRALLADMNFKDYSVQSVKYSQSQQEGFRLRIGSKASKSLGALQEATGTQPKGEQSQAPADSQINRIRVKIQDTFAEAQPIFHRAEYISSQVSKSQGFKTVMAITFSFVAMAIYLTFRFHAIYTAGVLLAIAHDIIIALGMISLTQISLTLPSIAAILTVMGYSINDSVIIYDRVRSITKGINIKKLDIKGAVNQALNSTFSRTLITSGTTSIALASIAFLGGEVIRSFAIIVLFGVFIGTISSITVSCNVLVMLKGIEQKKALAANRLRQETKAVN